MPAQLVALTEGPNILLDKPILMFGRHPECDVQLHSRKISRRHCCIAQVNEFLIVRDLGSTNGIRVNGERVLEGRLKDGDELWIGSHRYRVAWPSAMAPEVNPRPPRPAVVPPGRPTTTSSDPLESCDEPIPLSEDRPRPPIQETARSSAFLLPKPPPPPSHNPFPAPPS
jgi:pSer/pThr/pTyr-binding forkhead associated (FHA) protein